MANPNKHAAPSTEIMPPAPAAPAQSGPPAPASAPSATGSAPPVLGEGRVFAYEPNELEKAHRELRELEDAQELVKVQARIDFIKSGGKTPGEVSRNKTAMEKRAKTFCFTDDAGKKFAKYHTKEERFMGTALVKKDSIVDIPWDILPGESLLPVEPTKPSDEKLFTAKEA